MIDLFRPYMASDVADHLARVVTPDDNGRVYVGEGPRVQEFETRFAELVGFRSPPPLTMNSCTSALELAVYLAGVTLGAEVITTPMTCSATSGAIYRAGGKLVWADVDPVTGLIDPEDVARKITKRTKAIMAVDWAGRSCDYRALRQVAAARAWDGIPIIQDAAHHLFVDPASHGDYVCWSFQAIKHLTTGDGGALLVPPEQHERARLLRWYGLDRTSSADFRCAQDITEVGFKMHMNDLAAAVGLANLPHAARVVARHRDNAEWYSMVLRDAPGIVPPPRDPGASWWLYTLLVDDRASLIDHLSQRGIASSPVHRRNDTHSVFAPYRTELPGVDAFASRELAIPVGWWVTNEDRERVAGAVIEWAHSRQPAKEVAYAA